MTALTRIPFDLISDNWPDYRYDWHGVPAQPEVTTDAIIPRDWISGNWPVYDYAWHRGPWSPEGAVYYHGIPTQPEAYYHRGPWSHAETFTAEPLQAPSIPSNAQQGMAARSYFDTASKRARLINGGGRAESIASDYHRAADQRAAIMAGSSEVIAACPCGRAESSVLLIVYNGSTGATVANASARLGAFPARMTDSNGNIIYDGVISVPQPLQVDAAGFQQYQSTVAPADNQFNPFQVALTPTTPVTPPGPSAAGPTTLQFTVVSTQGGALIPGAQVTVDGNRRVAVPALGGNSDYLGVSAGSHSVTVQAAGFNTTTGQVSVVAGENKFVTLQMQPTPGYQPPAPISGLGPSLAVRVLDLNNQPVPSTSVRLTGAGSFAQITGPDGSTTFQSIPAGAYHMTAIRTGYNAFESDFTLDQSRNLSVTLRPAGSAAVESGSNFGKYAIIAGIIAGGAVLLGLPELLLAEEV